MEHIKNDKALMHFRRYNKQEIKEIFKQFNTIILTYYNFLLFLPAALAIIIFKILKFKFINTVENSPNQLISKILFNTFVVEKNSLML